MYCSVINEILISSNYDKSRAKYYASTLDGYKNAVWDLELRKEDSGKYELSALKIFDAFIGLGNGELDPSEACDFDFGDLIKSSPRYLGDLLPDENSFELEAAIISGQEHEWMRDEESNFQLFFYLEQK